MQRQGRQAEQYPYHFVFCRYAEKVVKTGNANIEPSSPFVSRIDLGSVGCHEALHAVVTSSQENRTNYVDENMQESIDRFSFVTALFGKQADTVVSAIAVPTARPYRERQID